MLAELCHYVLVALPLFAMVFRMTSLCCDPCGTAATPTSCDECCTDSTWPGTSDIEVTIPPGEFKNDTCTETPGCDEINDTTYVLTNIDTCEWQDVDVIFCSAGYFIEVLTLFDSGTSECTWQVTVGGDGVADRHVYQFIHTDRKNCSNATFTANWSQEIDDVNLCDTNEGTVDIELPA